MAAPPSAAKFVQRLDAVIDLLGAPETSQNPEGLHALLRTKSGTRPGAHRPTRHDTLRLWLIGLGLVARVPLVQALVHTHVTVRVCPLMVTTRPSPWPEASSRRPMQIDTVTRCSR
jgi:hypothetical protein